MRLIAFSIIILSGALALGLGSVAERSKDATGMGLFVMIVGGALTGIELYLNGFFHEFREALSKQSPAPRRRESSESPNEIPPPTVQ